MISYNILMEHAKKASKNAYAPYSNFKVGACVLTEDDNIYTGCNFENSSYGLTICAERNAIGSAIVAGAKKIVAVAIYSPNRDNCFPCGACRQVIYEFRSDSGTDVITEADGNLICQKIERLLPEGFSI